MCLPSKRSIRQANIHHTHYSRNPTSSTKHRQHHFNRISTNPFRRESNLRAGVENHGLDFPFSQTLLIRNIPTLNSCPKILSHPSLVKVMRGTAITKMENEKNKKNKKQIHSAKRTMAKSEGTDVKGTM